MAPPVTCICGTCAKCKRRVYMRGYYRRPGVADKARATAIASRQRRIEDVRAKDRERGGQTQPPTVWKDPATGFIHGLRNDEGGQTLES